MKNMMLVTSILEYGDSTFFEGAASYYLVDDNLDEIIPNFSLNKKLNIITYNKSEIVEIKLGLGHVYNRGWGYICQSPYVFPKPPFIISDIDFVDLTPTFNGEIAFELSNVGKSYVDLHSISNCYSVSTKNGLYGFLTRHVKKKNIFQKLVTYSFMAFGKKPKEGIAIYLFDREDKSDIHIGTIKSLNSNSR